MANEGLKKLILEAINSNPSTRKKAEALASGRLGDILQCYKESVDEYWPEKTGLDRYARENFLLSDILCKPQKTRATLTSWAKFDVRCSIVEKTGKRPDEYEFEIAFQQVMDELHSGFFKRDWPKRER